MNIKTLKSFIHHSLLLLLACVLSSCGGDGFREKIVGVDVDVDDVATALVINGKIELDSNAFVQISYSEDIDAVITPINYEENASVTISTGGSSVEQLVYRGNGKYTGSSIFGEVDETYTMTIEISDETYTAISTMFPPPGYRDAWVTQSVGGDGGKGGDGKDNGKGGSTVYYSDEWQVLDPPETRDRYLFEWWTNGNHIIQRDWCIDDNRVVNAGGALRLFNVTIDPGPNEHTRFRAAEVDKITYDYYNMYEKIVRGIISVASQTPYNPVSNFGKDTVGNFRAVAFSSAVILTPPSISASGGDGQVVISFPLNSLFTKYNLYWSTSPGITNESDVIGDIQFSSSGKSSAAYTHENITKGASYYYRMEVEDAEGNVSILSPEVSAEVASVDGTKPDDGTKPNGDAPTNVTATAGKGEIVITWYAVDGAGGHLIYWGTKPGVTSDGKSNIIYESKTELSSPYTHTGLDTGVTYYYKVAAFIGKEVYLSEEVSATPE